MNTRPRRVVVNDLMQTDYVYVLVEPAGKNFHPDFRPDLTPQAMLALGVFGGKYRSIARKRRSSVVVGSGRHCCTGRMMPGAYDPKTPWMTPGFQRG